MPCKLSQYIKPSLMIMNLENTYKEGVIKEISEYLAGQTGLEGQNIYAKLLEREKKASTGAEFGVAIPHASIPQNTEMIVCLARSQKGVDFDAIDGAHSHLFFVILIPEKPHPEDSSYLQIISTICRLVRDSHVREELLQAVNEQGMIEALKYKEA